MVNLGQELVLVMTVIMATIKSVNMQSELKRE